MTQVIHSIHIFLDADTKLGAVYIGELIRQDPVFHEVCRLMRRTDITKHKKIQMAVYSGCLIDCVVGAPWTGCGGCPMDRVQGMPHGRCAGGAL